MYKKTILEHSRDDLDFHLLLFFLVLKDSDGNSLAYSLFKNNLSKVKDLLKEFSNKKRNLETGEYAEYKDKLGLTNIMKYDVFFYLIKIFANTTKTEIIYNEILKNDIYVKSEINKIEKDFGKVISEIFYDFSEYKIEDLREDINGENLDLSKSIYHPIMMRMSKRMDLTLSYRTDIKSLISKSPLDITFLQYIDPTILFDIWDRFSLIDYGVNIGKEITLNNLLNSSLLVIVGEIAYNKIKLRKTNKKTKEGKESANKIEKDITNLKKDFVYLNDSKKLSKPIEDKIERSDKNLEETIESLKNEIEQLKKQNKPEYIINKALNDLKKYENITVTINIIENQNIYNISGDVAQLQNQTSDSTQN